MLFDVDLELSEVDSKVLEKSKEILGGVIKHGYIVTELSMDEVEVPRGNSEQP